MATNIPAQLEFRIPNLPSGPIVDKNGNATPAELNFRQALLSALQNIVGNEGMQTPNQSATNIATIVANSDTVPGTDITNFTCAGGTLLYDSTNDSLKVVILVGGTPTLKTVTVT